MTPVHRRWSIDWKGVVVPLPRAPAISPAKAQYEKKRSIRSAA